jgi:hypothetical protein
MHETRSQTVSFNNELVTATSTRQKQPTDHSLASSVPRQHTHLQKSHCTLQLQQIPSLVVGVLLRTNDFGFLRRLQLLLIAAVGLAKMPPSSHTAAML